MMLRENRRQEVIALCQSLVRARSYSGEENEVANVLATYMKNGLFDEISVDKYGNIIGRIKGKKKGPKILFDGHMDTVPVSNESEWQYPPFAAEIRDNKIYGRGTTDMKGALAGMVAAAKFFAADLEKDFAGVVHEECFEGVAAREVSKLVEPDYVIIGEASNLNLKIGQRGRAEIVLETFGKSCHSANPEKGINAVYAMCKAVAAIRKLKATHHAILGDGILELTDIKSLPYPGASVVPDYCKATYDRRLLIGETKESVLEPIEALLDEIMQSEPNLKYKISYATGTERCYTGNEITGERFFPGWLYDKNEKFITDIFEELKKIGYKPEIKQYNFCTNASHYAGEAGIKTIGMGPSKENIAHTVDEYIEIEQLLKVTECYYGIMMALVK